MKTLFTTALLLAGASFVSAQSNGDKEKQETKIRIKKIENINGLQKITDTTILVNGSMNGNNSGIPSITKISADPGQDIVITEEGDVVHVTSNSNGDKNSKSQTVIVTKDGKDNEISMSYNYDFDSEIQNAMKEAGELQNGQHFESVVMVNTNGDSKEGKKGSCKIVIIKSQKLLEPSEEDKKLLDKQTGLGDQKLKLDQMKFYPNPGNGKFNLSFDLKEKGDTDIQVMNAEGRTVYSEKLKSFSGHYDKEIDITSEPKGIYFVKVNQGSHSLVKKLVTE